MYHTELFAKKLSRVNLLIISAVVIMTNYHGHREPRGGRFAVSYQSFVKGLLCILAPDPVKRGSSHWPL